MFVICYFSIIFGWRKAGSGSATLILKIPVSCFLPRPHAAGCNAPAYLHRLNRLVALVNEYCTVSDPGIIGREESRGNRWTEERGETAQSCRWDPTPRGLQNVPGTVCPIKPGPFYSGSRYIKLDRNSWTLSTRKITKDFTQWPKRRNNPLIVSILNPATDTKCKSKE